MASSAHNHNGGGYNTLCMHNEPQYPPHFSDGDQNGNLLYGMEYQTTGAIDKHHDGDAACAVCEHSSASNVYTQWGRTTCSNGHTTEYSGVIMSNSHTQKKGESMCVDLERARHAASDGHNHDGGLLYTSEMEGGSSDEEKYPHNREVACAICARPVAGMSLDAVHGAWCMVHGAWCGVG